MGHARPALAHRALRATVRSFARSILARVDAWYQRKHHLRALGPVLRIGYVHYEGPTLTFDDGTRLEPNELIGQLHFNNSSIAAIGEGSLHRTGLRFAKLMRESLHTLAHAAQHDPEVQRIRVFHGVTWIPEHGNVVGFISTPRPKTWRTRVLAWYFRLLMWTFAPAARTRAKAQTEPRDYWLTQRMLVENAHKLLKARS